MASMTSDNGSTERWRVVTGIDKPVILLVIYVNTVFVLGFVRLNCLVFVIDENEYFTGISMSPKRAVCFTRRP
jgi:hypothetical protein